MRVFCLGIVWLSVALIDQSVFGEERQTKVSKNLESVIEKAHGNAKHLKRLLRIKELEQRLNKRDMASVTGDEQTRPERADNEVTESNTGSSNTNRDISTQYGSDGYRYRLAVGPNKNNEDSLHNGRSRKYKRTSKKKLKGGTRKHKGTNKKRLKRFRLNKNKNRVSKMQGKPKHAQEIKSRTGNKNKVLARMNRKQCLRHVIRTMRPTSDKNNKKKAHDAENNSRDIKDTASMPEMKQLEKDIKYLETFADALREKAIQKQATAIITMDDNGDDTASKTKQLGENRTVVEALLDGVNKDPSPNGPKTGKMHLKPADKQTSESLLADKTLWLGLAVGSGFSFVTFILCCCLYKCILYYRSSLGVPLKDALGIFKVSGVNDKSPRHITVTQKKGDKGRNQYVVSILGKAEDPGSSSEEEEVYNRSSINTSGNTTPVKKNSTNLTPPKTKKPALQ